MDNNENEKQEKLTASTSSLSFNEIKQDGFLNSAISGAAYETIQRYGSAVKEHYTAYSGIDNETGKKFVKSLNKISKEKINPDYKFQNIHQQAGFSAEVKEVARTNAQNILNNNPNRMIRTDDLGKVNDQIADTVMLDASGNIIKGTQIQTKFIGSSKDDPSGANDAVNAFKKLKSKSFDKYFDNNTKISVPSDQYEKIINEADLDIDKLKKQLEKQKELNNTEQIESIKNKIKRVEAIKKNLRKSPVSKKEAVEARLNPKLSTIKDVNKISYQAGLKTAETAAIISASVSTVKNFVAVAKGEKDVGEAALDVVSDTSVSAVLGFSTGYTGSAIKGLMQNSKSTYIRGLSKTNVAGTLVATTVSVSKIMLKYLKGEIDETQCLMELGQEGTGMVSSAMFAAVGQVVIPVPVLGGLIGGMFGYALSSATYGILVNSLQEEKMAHEYRIKVEKACEEHIKNIRKYRAEIEKIINEYLSGSMDIFSNSFSGIKNALAIGDVDWFIDSTNKITEAFGGKVQFSSMDEFNEKMLSSEAFKL